MAGSPNSINGRKRVNGAHRRDDSAAAEMTLLGTLLERGDIAPEVTARLSKNDFYADCNQRVFGAIQDLVRRGVHVDHLTVLAETAGCRADVPAAYFGELLTRAAAAAGWPYWADILRQARARREMARVGQRMVDESARPTMSADDAVSVAKQEIASLADSTRAEHGLQPIVASALQAADPLTLWLWRALIARGSATLLSALWKSGKTTLVSHLLRLMGEGGEYLGQPVSRGRALVISEEHEKRWAERRDQLGLGDHVSFVLRPFGHKPGFSEWNKFVESVATYMEKDPFDLIVLDTLSNLWPVRDENDAAHVQEALMPLHQLAKTSGLLLVHHLGKSDGRQATGSRGSGALTAWVDAILELRRFAPEDCQDRRRVISGYARWDGVPNGLVIELAVGGYLAHGDRHDVLRRTLLEILPEKSPGMTYDKIREAWDPKPAPRKDMIMNALRTGLDRGDFAKDGSGKRGSPFAYWLRGTPE